MSPSRVVGGRSALTTLGAILLERGQLAAVVKDPYIVWKLDSGRSTDRGTTSRSSILRFSLTRSREARVILT